MGRSRSGPTAKATLEETERGVRIVFHPKREWGGVAFLSAWLCGWALGEVMATVMSAKMVSQILRGEGTASILPAAFVLLWLAFWTFGGVKAVQEVLKNIRSAERIEIDSERVRVYRGGLFSVKFVEYPTYLVRNLGVRAAAVVKTQGKRRGATTVRTALTFVVDGEPVEAGAELTQSEAGAILKGLAERYPYIVGVDEDSPARGSDRPGQYEEA
jgi:hypothetical protein